MKQRLRSENKQTIRLEESKDLIQMELFLVSYCLCVKPWKIRRENEKKFKIIKKKKKKKKKMNSRVKFVHSVPKEAGKKPVKLFSF